ncbi:VOC family protein [Myxococcus sp. RHSTA-1-4]|uniref:VOC family protein n=1 Tax=Myxococcus sp. RHSTA-1-4 TaxID=2874601 RepID=UPI001CBAE7BD|nr:VOC family protein [Myxococcus sp. RHSTA-1-4]
MPSCDSSHALVGAEHRRNWGAVEGGGLEQRGRGRPRMCAARAVRRAGPFKVEVDLMQPINPEGKPRVHETPLNHVGLWVDDLPTAVKWLEEQGLCFAPRGIRCFVHPTGNEQLPFSGEGVLIERVQAPPESIAAFEGESAGGH